MESSEMGSGIEHRTGPRPIGLAALQGAVAAWPADEPSLCHARWPAPGESPGAATRNAQLAEAIPCMPAR